MSLKVVILAFDGMEALDFAGPFEVFTTAARMAQRMGLGQDPWCTVQCVAASDAPVAARAGLRVLPDFSFTRFASVANQPADILLIPGGVVDAALKNPATLAWIAHQSASAGITASVCTGAFLLAGAGVLTDQRVTTHWEDLADLQNAWPKLQVLGDVRWVDNGRTITSAGISAGIDMSLHLVERLGGRVLAERTARQMDFSWTQN